jgi:hypothetical protein
MRSYILLDTALAPCGYTKPLLLGRDFETLEAPRIGTLDRFALILEDPAQDNDRARPRASREARRKLDESACDDVGEH